MFGGVGLGGGSKGDVLIPRRLVPAVASGIVWTESPIVRGISSYRTILFYLETQAFGVAGQIQLRINWYRGDLPGDVAYQAVRRNAASDLVPDEPLLPLLLGVQRFAIPAANPGGATGVSIGFLAVVNTPNVEIYYSGES